MSQHKQREAAQAGKQADARQIVDAIDNLIKFRIIQQANLITSHKDLAAFDDECEFVKRLITDYLLATDPRQGVYVQGEHR